MGFLRDIAKCAKFGYNGKYDGYTLNDYYKTLDGATQAPDSVDTEVPYYIDLEIQALQEQIKVNDEIIQEYRWKEQLAINDEKRLYWKKKRVDLEYKNTQLDKKQYKLIEKYRKENL